MKEKNLLKKEQQQMLDELREKELIEQIEKDFDARRKERLALERQWELNMNFLMGNQHCALTPRGDLAVEDKSFYWQNRGVYNHIAPILDSRLARFEKVAPEISVRPKSDDDKDVASAFIAEKLVAEAFKRCDFPAVTKKVTTWSETCGTGFYKIVWNSNGGNKIGQVNGQDVFEGDVDILPISPFEIFPDSIYNSDLADCKSLIHAKAMGVKEVKEKYGVILQGGNVNVNRLVSENNYTTEKSMNGVLKDAVIVIERYVKPSKEHPNGRLDTVAGGKLLYSGDMPYINGNNESRDFPFVKQISFAVPGMFFGTSIIERLIPIQRAFNAVKNRKHEFMNRLSMGIMKVEDGSIDIDDLAEDGLSPGKVLVYRQGSTEPKLMEDMSMPADFNEEEMRLLNEFVTVSGVSDVSSSSSNASLSSGSALEILMEQDNSRLVTTAEYIRRSFIDVSKQIIRLYAQFTVGTRVISKQGDFGKIKVYYADKQAIKSDDAYLESENELLYTNRQRKEMIFKLFESGLLADENGKLRPSTKEKVLTLLGYKDLDYQKGIARLQEEKAQDENQKLYTEQVGIDEIDDDAIHIDEHVRFVLCEYQTMSEEVKQKFYAHIREHKQKLKAGESENEQYTK